MSLYSNYLFQTYLRRRKFKLFASFVSATMITETDGPVEFEVSIGKCKEVSVTTGLLTEQLSESNTLSGV